jgi:hypothetical protein
MVEDLGSRDIIGRLYMWKASVKEVGLGSPTCKVIMKS